MPELTGSYQQQQQYSQQQHQEPQQEMYSNFQQAQSQMDPSSSYEQQQQQYHQQQQQVQYLQEMGQMHQQVSTKLEMECHITFMLFRSQKLHHSNMHRYCPSCRKWNHFPYLFVQSPSTINTETKSTILPHPINNNIHINKIAPQLLLRPIINLPPPLPATATLILLRTIQISPFPTPSDPWHP